MHQVLDEADRLLDLEFAESIEKLVKLLPRERTTYLFSATMTTKVAKLQRASLTNPVKVEVNSKCVVNPFFPGNSDKYADTKQFQHFYNTTS